MNYGTWLHVENMGSKTYRNVLPVSCDDDDDDNNTNIRLII